MFLCRPLRSDLIDLGLSQTGPLLITHWGLSGPAVLKLSAWAARELHALDYRTNVEINWLPESTEEELRQIIGRMKQTNPAKQVGTESPFELQNNSGRHLYNWLGLNRSLDGLCCQINTSKFCLPRFELAVSDSRQDHLQTRICDVWWCEFERSQF